MGLFAWHRIFGYTATYLFGLVAFGVCVVIRPPRYVLEFQLVPPTSISYCSPDPLRVLRIEAGGLKKFEGTLLDEDSLLDVLHRRYDSSPSKLIYLDVSPQVAYGEMIALVAVLSGVGIKVFVIGEPGRCDPNGSWHWD